MATMHEDSAQTARDDALFRMIGYMTGAALTSTVLVGDALGFYRAMRDAGPMTAAALARQCDTNERLTREWLDSQAAGGILMFNADDDTYELDEAMSMVVAVEDSPYFIAGGMDVVRAMFIDADRLVDVFRSGGGFSWSDHDDHLFRGTGRFFRPGYLNFLATTWIPALEGVDARLNDGGKVLDVGCGLGYSSMVIADAFPGVTVTGIDFHDGSINLARENLRDSPSADRIDYRVADAMGYAGTYDLICFFDCLHDMGDPVGIAQYAKRHLAPGGSVMLVEPFAMDDRAANMGNPAAPMYYAASTFLCTPNALSQGVQRALGAQSGESGMRAIFDEAGYSSFRRAAETPFNIVYQARA